MHQHHRYKNPPIEEALCEFRFKPGRDWDFTIPGKLQTELGDEYTGKPQQQTVFEVGLETQEGRPPNFQYKEGVVRVKLVTKGGNRMVGIGPDVLSVHMLRPYQDPDKAEEGGWVEFRPRIETALGAYWKVAEPMSVCRIGMRYINKIIVPQKIVKVSNYLTCALPEVSGLPDSLSLKHFMSRVEYAYQDGVHLVVSQGLIEAPSDHVGFLLDLDVIWEGATPLVCDEALKKASELRTLERVAFETVITDKTRELFDAD